MADALTDGVFYVGEFEKPLDDKRRLTVPSKWRFKGDDSDVAYLAIPNVNGSISVYPPSMIAKLMETVSKVGMSNPSAQRQILRLFGSGDRFGCDKQGRIVLSEKLMKHAGIEKETVAAGALTHFQIWNPERYKKYLEEGDESPESILEKLGL